MSKDEEFGEYELLGRAGDRVQVNPAPTSATISRAGRTRRRQAVTVRLISAAAVVAAFGGAALWSTSASTPEPRPTASPPGPTALAPDVRLVGLGQAAVAVPRGWGTNATHCGTPLQDTVVIDVAVIPACGIPRPEGVESVTITQGEPRPDFTSDQSFTLDGVPAQRQSTTCKRHFGDTRVCSGAVYLPTMRVAFRAESSTGVAEVDSVLADIQIFPGLTGVPGYASLALDEQENSGRRYLKALREAGLAGEIRTEKGSSFPAGFVVDVSPPPGTMLEPGSVVTVTLAGEKE